MRKTLAIVAAMLAFPAAVHAADSYFIRVTILDAKGQTRTFGANKGAHYPTETECRLRLQAWERQELPSYESAAAAIRKEGKTAEVSAECSPSE